MEHTNEIAIKILSKEYIDYKKNNHNRWHYDREYKLIVKALELSKKLESKTN